MRRLYKAVLLATGFGLTPAGALAQATAMLVYPTPDAVRWSGLLGKAINQSYEKRLHHFIIDETSEPVRLFDREKAEQNTMGRYWGEHTGKWLFAASRAAVRTGDNELARRVRRVADYLVDTQTEDGYIGTYPHEWRFMTRQRELTRGRWDVWVTAYVMLGLLETSRSFPNERYVNAVRRLADLCHRTFSTGEINITDLSNHTGLSSVILLEPVADLYGLTREPRYLELAKSIIRSADEHPDFGLTKKSLAGADIQTIATGKAYQLCWLFFGVAKLYHATGDTQYLKMAENAAASIRRDHLTLGGGPWGGIASHRETFNPKGFFSPYGFVETCSIMSWIQLNRELLSLTGNAVYAEEIERTAYNALLGAQDQNGEDWCYYTFPNGRRVNTSHWKCCKSSGAMALEELGPAAYAVRDQELYINLYGSNRAVVTVPSAGQVGVSQTTGYPFTGTVCLMLRLEMPARFAIALRIPSWGESVAVAVNGELHTGLVPAGKYCKVVREWRNGDVVTLEFPMHPMLRKRSNFSLQDTNEVRDGERIMQTVMRYDYVAITRGPLVYATGLIDGYKQEETLRLQVPGGRPLLEEIAPAAPGDAPSVRLSPDGREPLVFVPYYKAGGRHDGTWRLTWMQVSGELADFNPNSK